MNVLSKLVGVLFFGLILICLMILSSCGPRPQYKTAKGKKKLKHYNSIQYGKTEPKTFKSYSTKKN